MSKFQLKTLENLVAKELRKPDSGYKIHSAYARAVDHFADEAYLSGVEHDKIIKRIYERNYYDNKSSRALSLELCLNTKTLLTYRRNYLKIIARHYFDLTAPTENDLNMLYEELINNK